MRSRNSLSLRLYIAAFLILGATIVVASAVMVVFERDAVQAAFDADADALVARLSASLPLALAGPGFRVPAVEALLRAEMLDGRVDYVVVRDGLGAVVVGLSRDASTGGAASGTAVQAVGAGSAAAAGRASDRVLSVDAAEGGAVLGTAEIGLSRRSVERGVIASLVRNGAGGLAAVLLGLLFFLAYLDSAVMDALRSMGGAVRRFGAMELSARIGKESLRSDEIGQLALAINRMSDTVQAYAADLEGLVRDRTERLIESEKMAFIGGLSVGVAREISASVGEGVGAASRLLESARAAKASLASGEGLSAIVDGAAGDADALMRSLSKAAIFVASFEKVAGDQNDRRPRTVELRSYVEDIVASLQPRLAATSHRVDIRVPAGLEWRGDPGILSQALSKLVINSLDHAYPDGSPGRMVIEAGRVGAMLELRYSDDGCGIAPADRARVFQPFFSTRRERGGMGLGLFIVSSVVTKAGGEIRCDSGPDGGTRFVLTLPYGRPE